MPIFRQIKQEFTVHTVNPYFNISGEVGALDLTAYTYAKNITLATNNINAVDLTGLTDLVYINVNNNPLLTTLNLSSLSSLRSLYLSANALLSSIIFCVSLDNITISGGLPALTTLDLSSCTSLVDISISNCAVLSSINVTGLTQLTSIGNIGAGCPFLTTLDFTGCTSLANIQQLALANLTSIIGLTGNTALASLLGVYQCALPIIDLSGCTSLTTLSGVQICASLTTINVSGCVQLATIQAFHNLILATVDITGCTSLHQIDLSRNALTQPCVDDILVKLDSFGNSGGTLALTNGLGGTNSGHGALGVAGLAAYNNLTVKGWTITMAA